MEISVATMLVTGGAGYIGSHGVFRVGFRASAVHVSPRNRALLAPSTRCLAQVAARAITVNFFSLQDQHDRNRDSQDHQASQ